MPTYILLNQSDSKLNLLLVKLKIVLLVNLLEFYSLSLKSEVMKIFQTLLESWILNFCGESFIFEESGPVVILPWFLLPPSPLIIST